MNTLGTPSPNTSVRLSGLPRVIRPMLSAYGDEPFDSEAHVFELLWEGLRVIVYVEGRTVRVQDGFGRDVTTRFPEFARLHQQLPRAGTALDGVVVALDEEGRPSFRGLMPRLVDEPLALNIASADPQLSFKAFDILYLDGQPVMSYTLRRRKEMLLASVRPNDRISVPEAVETEGVDLFDAATQHGLGGIVAKEWDAQYSPGRTSLSWQAIRSFKTQKFVVAGFTFGGPWRGKTAAKHRSAVESILLGLYDEDDVLRFVGEASGDFAADETTVEMLNATTAKDCPFGEPPTVAKLVFWCRPELAASVRYSEWTQSGILRFPLFDALRPDVPPETCRFRDA